MKEKIEEINNEELFTEAYEKYYKKVYYTALRVLYDVDDAEEVAQEVFTYFYEKPELYDKTRPLEGYLVHVAKMRAITRKKKFARREEIVDANKGFMADISPEENIGKSLEKEDEAEFVRKVIEELKPEYRDVIKLIYLEGKDYAEIAKILNKTENNIKVIHHRAKAKLKRVLEEKGYKEYFLNFIIIALVILGLSCTYNIAKNKLFKNPNSYNYNDNSIELNIETVENYKWILKELNIENIDDIKIRYIPVTKDNKDVLEIYNEEFSLKICDEEILDFYICSDSSNINVLETVNETTIAELDKRLYNDNILETNVVANENYKMINVIINESEKRIYTISNENKLLQIRNMKENFIENSIEINEKEVEKIVKEKYGEDIIINSIELTQTKLNTVTGENKLDMYFEDNTNNTDNYENLNFSNKNYNFYLVWKVDFTRKTDSMDKTSYIYIDTYSGKIIKNQTYNKI